MTAIRPSSTGPMFDSFDDDYVNGMTFRQTETSVEENDEDDDDEDSPVGHKHHFTNLNQFVDTTYNQILYKPLEILKSSQRPFKRNKDSLREKLFDIYLEENASASTTNFKNLNYSTNLLEKLVERENLNTLVLNFYPMEKGYSLGFNVKHAVTIDKKNNSDTCDFKAYTNHLAHYNSIETKIMSYDETELLFYINAGEIPPVVIDLIDRLHVNLFNDGCIILEVRDYRRMSQLFQNGMMCGEAGIEKSYDLRFILLQPSMQTLLADLNSITNDGNFIWTQEDKYTLESQLILATAQPLCLHPSPIVSILKHKFLNHKYKLNDRKLKRTINKFTNVYLNRSSKWNEYALPMPFHIRKIRKKFSKTNEYLHFQTTNADNPGNSKQLDEKLKKQLNIPTNSTSSSSFLITSLNFQSVDNWSKTHPEFKLPHEDMILVKKFAKTSDKPKYSNEQTLVTIEEIILEAVDKSSKNNYSRLLIKRRVNDDIYFCQLSLCNDQTNEVLFRLGLAIDAEKYIQQYIKIFTEEGRRPVAITKNTPPSGNQRLNSLLKDANIGYSCNETAPSAFKLVNGISFQSYFKKKNSTEFVNDKQLQTYQNFLYQQHQHQQQQIQLQKQQMQKHLHNQIKRIKSSNDEQVAKNNITDSINATVNANYNLKNLVQTPTHCTNLTRVNNANSLAKSSTFKSEPNKNEQIIITATTPKTSVKKKSSPSAVPTKSPANPTEIKPKQNTQITNSNTGAHLNNSQKSANSPHNFVQIYVPKIASPNLIKPGNNSTPNKPQINSKVSSPASTTQPTKKTYAKRRASSSSSTTKSPVVEEKKKITASTEPTNNSNATTAVPKADTNTTTKSFSMPNTKIINASNFNLLRKIAIDSRSMPVIVTLNSSDTNDLNQQQNIQHQLKLKSQQQSKQIKFINNRVTLKPAITNSNNGATESGNPANDHLQNNISNTMASTSSGNHQNDSPLNSIRPSSISPIKTFQFQKSTPMLKQFSFTYGSQNIHNIKPTTTLIHSSSSSSNILSTIPINSNTKSSTTTPSGNETQNSSNQGIDKASTKFLVNTNNQKTPIVSQIRQNIMSTTSVKSSLVIKKPNGKESTE